VVNQNLKSVVIVSPDGEIQLTIGKGKDSPGRIIAVSPDEKYLYTSPGEKAGVFKWDLETGDLLLRFAHSEGESFYALLDTGLTTLLPDGSGMIVRTSDNLLTLWDTETGEAIRQIARVRHLGAIGFNDDGTIVYFVARDRIHIYELETGESRGIAYTPNAYFSSFAGSPDGDRVAGHYSIMEKPENPDGPSRVVGYELRILEFPGGEVVDQLEVESSIERIYWLKSGRYLLVCCTTELLMIEVEGMKVVARHAFPDNARSTYLSPDQKTFSMHIGLQTDSSRNIVVPNFFTYGREP
jgi:WD40 repeat protein